MDNVRVKIIKSDSADSTEFIGEKIGKNLRGGEVIELVSDLGGGKTTITRGITRGAGSSDVVGSPTFMISKTYVAPKLEIHHFDFYRLTEAGLMEHELQEALADPKVVIVVEWGEIVQRVLPESRMTIKFKKTSDDERELKLSYSANMTYLVDSI